MLNRILFGTKYGICIFCGRKTQFSDSVFHKDNVCICRKCNSYVKIAPFNLLHEGTEHLSFVVSPLYYSPLVRDAIHNLKFSSMPKTAEGLAYYINIYLEVFAESECSLMDDFDIIIPVPLSKFRLNKRGYNQAEILANCIGKHFQKTVDTHALIKIKNTPPQSTLSYSEKLKNPIDAYECKKDFSGKRILLVDDVCTTKTTLEACAKELKASNALTVAAVTVSYGGLKAHSQAYNEMFS